MSLRMQGRRALVAAVVAIAAVAGIAVPLLLGASGDVEDDGCPPATAEAVAEWGPAGFSGSVALVEDGALTCSTGTHGLAGSAFDIGSVTKVVTAAAVVRLADAGRLDLDGAVGRWFPDLPDDLAAVTPRQLIGHTSGLPTSHGADGDRLTRDAALAAIGRQDLLFRPGSDDSYSNSGYTLLAALVEEASGQSYRAYVAGSILAPADVDASWWDEGTPTEGEHWGLEGNGGLVMTAPDLARWVAGLDRDPALDAAVGVVEVAGATVLTAAGGGGDSPDEAVVAWLPDRRTALAVASNTPAVTAGTLVEAVLPAFVAGDPLPPPEPPADVDTDGFLGRWALDGGGELAITADGDRLEVAAVGPDALARLFPPASTDQRALFDAHEAAVEALLAGETDAGRDELATLAEDLGRVTGVEIAGTIAIDGEIRTFVTLRLEGGAAETAWYALEDGGQVAGVELAPSPPVLRVGAVGPDAVGPLDSDGEAPPVVLRLVDGGTALELVGPDGATRGAHP